MNNKNQVQVRQMSDKARWTLILTEMALCYTVAYVSAYYNWPKHEYILFFVMVPLYQAGVTFGYMGGIIGSIIISLLFMPLIPIDPFIALERNGLPYALGMIAFINIFGVFIGGAIGSGRKVMKEVDALSRASDAIAQETEEQKVMFSLLHEALNFLGARFASVLIRGDGDDAGVVYGLTIGKDEPERIIAYSDSHPLSRAAAQRRFYGTNCANSSPRFNAAPHGETFRSVLAVPVAVKDIVYGSLLIAGKRDEELFTKKDLSVLQMLADTAAATIQNLEEEINRQEEHIKERRMKELFSRFVSSSVADYVLENPELLEGRRQEVTVLVSDIRDFTSISETMTPHQIVEQLNEYFTEMVEVIFRNNGTIDKFIGDCIIAYWGAPAQDPDHAGHAARTAMDMAAALDKLNARWDAEGRRSFRAGIGLHTSDVLMGNLGDDRKKTFTIMGEEVERAMNIEALTKHYGVRIIASEKTRKQLPPEFSLEALPVIENSPFGTLHQMKIA